MIRAVLISLLLIPAGMLGPGAPRTGACTPPPLRPLEEIALADAIAVVNVDSVRGPENYAPTVTPIVVSPPVATPPGPYVDGMPDDFSLEGYGATLSVARLIVGTLPEKFDVDEKMRSRIEEIVRLYEAGRGSNCPVSDVRLRYLYPGLYLGFFRETDAGYETLARYVVNGSGIIANHDLISDGGAFLILDRATAERFFAPDLIVPLDSGSLVELQGQVPFDDLLAAIAYLRNDPTITLPETGTAGLLSESGTEN